MINVDEFILKIIKEKDDYVVVFDFDYTLTNKKSNSSIGVFTNYLPQKYGIKKRKLDYQTNKYKNKFMLSLIWNRKLKLLSKYYSLDVVKKINYPNEFKINKKVFNIFSNLVNSNANVVICSSGMKEIIKEVLLLNNIDVSRLLIIANDIDFQTKKIKNKIINPKNKKVSDLKKYKKVVLIGDSYNDLKLCKDAIKILVDDNNLRLIEGEL